jgi:hypothetical protein
MLEAALLLVEVQADAGIPAGGRDFTDYVANVLFDDWDEAWADAPSSTGFRRPAAPGTGAAGAPTDRRHSDAHAQ